MQWLSVWQPDLRLRVVASIQLGMAARAKKHQNVDCPTAEKPVNCLQTLLFLVFEPFKDVRNELTAFCWPKNSLLSLQMSRTFITMVFFIFLGSVGAQTCYKTVWPSLTWKPGAGNAVLSVPLPVYSQQYVVYIEASNPTGDDQFGIAVYSSAQGSPPSPCLGSQHGELPYPPPYCNLISSGSTQTLNMVSPIETNGWDSNPLIDVICLDSCFTNQNCNNVCEIQLSIIVCHNSTFPMTSCGTSFASGAFINPCAIPSVVEPPYKEPQVVAKNRF